MPVHAKFRYRAEIDGLRALAVLLVVVFHAGLGCSGGFVGVDVFFVISGYLITSLLWKDLETGTFRFGEFWERRARRIVPALVVMVLATLAAAWFIFLPADFENLGKAATAQSMFAANVFYWQDLDYFNSAADEKPLLHTWSLAVEEQYYLIIPLVLFGLFRVRHFRSRIVVMALICAGCAISLRASISALRHDAPAAFYLLPSRAWELMLGSLVAFAPLNAARRSRLFLETIALAGLGMILLCAFTYTEKNVFPGLAAIPPCLGAAFFIWANGSSKTIAGSFLSLRPVVFIGLVSYSFYLWHWPFLAFSKYLAVVEISVNQRIGLVLGGFACAVLSWQFVEKPFREKRLGKTKRCMLAMAGAGVAGVCALGLAASQTKGFPQRLPSDVVAFLDSVHDRAFDHNTTLDELRSGTLSVIGDRSRKSAPAVLLWGDSHAMAAAPAVDSFLLEKGISGTLAAYSSVPPVLDWSVRTPVGMTGSASDFNQSVFDYLQRAGVKDVILCARWGYYVSSPENSGNSFEHSLIATVRRIRSLDVRVWLLLDVPGHAFDVPRFLARHFRNLDGLGEICSKPGSKDELELRYPELIPEIREAGGQVIDLKPPFLDPSARYYRVEADRTSLYFDRNHLTAKGAKLILLPLLRTELKIAAEGRARP